MKKGILLTFSALGLWMGMSAQIVLKNDGAMLVVEPGATLVVQGGVENTNGGTINNDGTINIQGDFLNTATFDGADVNTVIFSGTSSANVTSGGAVFHHVTMDKASGQGITLTDDMALKGTLTFQADNNKINLGANDLTVQDPGSIAGADGNQYVVTGGAGYLRKEGLGASETFTFPVGYNSATYNPAVLTGNVGHTSDVFSVRALENVQADGLTGANLTEGVAGVSWEINEGVDGGSDVDVTLQWAGSDELTGFDRTMSAVSRHDGTGWDMLFGDLDAAGGGNPYTRTRDNVDDFSVFAVGSDRELAGYVEADVRVILQGPYISGGVQSDDLREAGVIPDEEPYDSYTFTGFGGDETVTLTDLNQGGNDDGIDWVIVELRDAGTPSTVVASRAAILQEDGDIVDVDGESFLKIYGVAPGSYYIAVQHRNHLGVMTANPVVFMDMGSFDFSNTANSIYGTAGATTVEGGTIRALWAGDVDASDFVNATDLALTSPVAAIGPTDVYHIMDINLSSFVNVTDLSIMAPNAAVGPIEQIPD